MALAAQLNATTALMPPHRLSAREREKSKGLQQWAEDVIYILNHTITCLTLTDLLILPSLRGLGFNVGHDEHGHGHGDHHDHGHGHPHTHEKTSFWSRVVKKGGPWIIGEGIGDVGAALVTLPVQRLFPGFMEGLQHLMEPLVSGIFRHGAKQGAERWADKHGRDYNSQAVVDRAQMLYDYEIRHLPQMAVWTVSSVGLHYGAMRYFEPEMKLAEFAAQKVVGAGITAGLVFGARALAPDLAHKWDVRAGKYVVVPMTKKVGSFFGVEAHQVDSYHAQQNHDDTPGFAVNQIAVPTTRLMMAPNGVVFTQ